MIVCE
jgi:hypothetical protein